MLPLRSLLTGSVGGVDDSVTWERRKEHLRKGYAPFSQPIFTRLSRRTSGKGMNVAAIPSPKNRACAFQRTRLKPPTTRRLSTISPQSQVLNPFKKKTVPTLRCPNGLYLSRRFSSFTLVYRWRPAGSLPLFSVRQSLNLYPPHYQRRLLPPASFTRWTVPLPLRSAYSTYT